ncbi:MAG: hypothetical protein KHX19_00660 [Bifidobacterium longum]|nr:hypothetical protein [Bifidobacterium longum]
MTIRKVVAELGYPSEGARAKGKIPHFKVGFGARCRANGESGVFVGAAG